MEFDEPDTETELATPAGSLVRQVAVFLQNRAGELLSIVKLLHRHDIIVLGLNVQDSTDTTVVRLIVSDPDSVESLFIERGIPFSTTDLIAVELKNGAEGLAECLHGLLIAETNIHFIYPVMSRPHGHPILAMHLEDNEFGRSVLLKNGFRVLMQEDLSR